MGAGLWPLSSAEAAEVVAEALRLGWRAFDTAALYDNEEGVGMAVRAASVPRREIFVTTKLHPEQQGPDAALRGIDGSLRRLGLDHVDLYLIHWPPPLAHARASTWRALAAIRQQGLAHSIGVSNFSVAQLRELIDETGIVPAVNQVELHPWMQQRRLRAFHAEHGIATECWSPLARGTALDEPTATAIARKHGRLPAQVLLRWHLDNGIVPICRSRSPAHLAQNLDVLDFHLDAADLAALDALDGQRDGRD
jgi:2,5-diketo-D-gluconate reductase A